MDLEARVTKLERLLSLTEQQVSLLSAEKDKLGGRLEAAAKDFAELRARLDRTDGEVFLATICLAQLMRRDPVREDLLRSVDKETEKFMANALHSTSSESLLRGFEERRDWLLDPMRG